MVEELYWWPSGKNPPIDAVKEKKNNGRPGHDVRRNEEDDKELDEAVERFLAGDYDDEPLF